MRTLERIRAIEGPVPAELFRAMSEDASADHLEIFDGGKSGESFPESDAFGEDTSDGAEELVDGGTGSVILKRVMGSPHAGFRNQPSG